MRHPLVRFFLIVCLLAVAGSVVYWQARQSSKVASPLLSSEGNFVLTANDVDIGFARSMMLHHDQAVQMSMMMIGSGLPHAENLSNAIVIKQTRENGVLEGWLTALGQATVTTEPPMAWVERATNVRHLDDQLYAAQCKASGGEMEGVATAEQLAQLAAATGEDKEKLFLELMIAHHQAAIPMGWFAFRNGEASLIKSLARSMVREQAFEIAWMQQRLAALGLQAPEAANPD